MNAPEDPSEIPDHRVAERVDITVPICIRLTDGNTIQSNTVNLSGGGAQLVCNKPIPEPSACHVELYLPDQPKALLFAGTIVRCSACKAVHCYEIAVQFHHSSADKQAFSVFSQFIATQLLLKHLS
jgi:hypothetical protein